MKGTGQQAGLGGNEALQRACWKGKTEGSTEQVNEEMLGVKSL